MVSDDTEHTVFVAQCLLAAPRDVAKFERKLVSKLKWWLACIPAGVGFATLRAILKLWLCFPPARSGVFSAGNGPAMRSAIIGAYFYQDEALLRKYVTASTRLTHTDPKAETAALAIALTAAWAAKSCGLSRPETSQIRALWASAGDGDDDWQYLMKRIAVADDANISVRDFAKELGLEKGVSGYCYHTVPVALYAWLHHWGDFRTSIEAVLNCGGDTDTVGAITGALAAMSGDIPSEWIEQLQDYPISIDYLRRLAETLAENSTVVPCKAPMFFWPMLPCRNFIFFVIVLGHGLRRLLPF
jgi:ADP-ribosylglycohydrolase